MPRAAHRRREGEEGPCAHWKRLKDQASDGGKENCKQLPRLWQRLERPLSLTFELGKSEALSNWVVAARAAAYAQINGGGWGCANTPLTSGLDHGL